MGEHAGRAEARCPQCGSDVGPFTDPTRATSIDIWDARAVRAFALGDDTGDRCPACGDALQTHQTFVLWDSHAPESGADALPGTYAQPFDLDSLVAATIGREPLETRVWATHDQLRRALVTRTREPINILNGFFASNPDERVGWVRENWRSIDARALITVPLALTGRLPGAGAYVASTDVDIDEEQATAWAHDELAQLETYLLLMLASQVAADATLSLADELARIIVPDVLEPTVAEFVTKAIVGIYDELDLGQAYVHLAVHAVMCASMGIENDMADAWAEHYITFEIVHSADDSLERLSLPPSLAGSTLSYETVWDALARRFGKSDIPWTAIEAVLDNAGHGEVLSQFVEMVRSGGRLDSGDADTMAAVLKRYPYEDSRDQFVWTALGFFRQLVVAGEPDQAERLLDEILADDRLDDDARWMVTARFGQACKEAGLPRRFLDRVGDEPSPEETHVSDVVRLALGVERSNAFRLEGRYLDALSALDHVEPLLKGEESSRIFMRNRAILLRDSGEPDQSIAILEAQLPSAIGADRLDVLESLVASHYQLGHRDAAHQYLDEAVTLAKGPLADRASRLIANQLNVAANQGDVDALRTIEKLDPGDNVPTLLALGGAWANIVRRGFDFDAEALEQVTDKLVDYINDEQGSAAYQMDACSALGVIYEGLGLDQAAEVWEREVALRRRAGSPEPMPLVALARHVLLDGDEDRALDLLLDVPEAMASMYGGVAHAGVAIDATQLLSEFLESLATSVLETDAAPAMRRLAAELQRDGAGRAKLIRQSTGDRQEQAALAGGLGDDVLRGLAPAVGRIHVVDWFTVDDGYVGQRTTIAAGGGIDLVPLGAPDFDLWPVAERMRARLDGWHARRAGEPFDLPEWLNLEAWFRTALDDVEPGDHVVVIDSPQHAGIPWHAIRDCPWTTSYASGWSSLLTLRSVEPSSLSSIGVVVVPADEDRPDVVDELMDASAAIAGVATDTGRAIASCIGTAADKDAVESMLRSVDVAVILCHGYAAADEREVALMLSNDGALPTTHAVAAGSVARRPHRWSWRDAVSLSEAPSLVISAACSSGTSHLAGLGERLGLYGSLRLRGTQSIVAPHWDVGAGDARDFVTTCLSVYLDGGMSLAQAMAAASTTLQVRGAAPWRRNCFALEGDWR